MLSERNSASADNSYSISHHYIGDTSFSVVTSQDPYPITYTTITTWSNQDFQWTVGINLAIFTVIFLVYSFAVLGYVIKVNKKKAKQNE